MSWLDHEVREVMTPGVVALPGDASLRRVHEALLVHRLHAVLVVDHRSGAPLGWVTPSGLLAQLSAGHQARSARQAIDERVVRISPSALARDAVAMLQSPGVTHLLVCHGEQNMPEGVVSSLNLLPVAAGRRP